MKMSLFTFIIPALLATGVMTTGCVHEWPETILPKPDQKYVTLTLHHELPWTLFDYEIETVRSDAEPMKVAYTFEAYPHGTTELCTTRQRVISDDLSMADKTFRINLPEGAYDVYIWCDYVDAATEESPYFDSSRFSAIKVRSPYLGGSPRKDAFQGHLTVDISTAPEGGYQTTLLRPLAAYRLIATDCREFMEREHITSLDGYAARVIYPLYLADEYSIFRDKPIDSATGLTFTTPLPDPTDDEVTIATDAFFINGSDSQVTLQFEIIDPDGQAVASSGMLTLPTRRNRITVARGRFLTSISEGGVGIDPGFEDDFNIPLFLPADMRPRQDRD